jgi:hypothetical protein
MDNKKIYCTVCGSLCGVIILMAVNPVCEKCLEDTIENPHSVEVRFPTDSTRAVYVSGITATAHATPVTAPFQMTLTDGSVITFDDLME